jgi:hypothetical protein
LQKQGLLYKLQLQQIADNTLPVDAAQRPSAGQVHVITREFKAQTNVAPLLRPILAQYRDTVMSGKPPDGTFEREHKATIDLLPGATPRMLRAYRLTPKEKQELDEQVAKLLDKGWIRPSSSAWGAPVLFAPKSNETGQNALVHRLLLSYMTRNNSPLLRTARPCASAEGRVMDDQLALQQGVLQSALLGCYTAFAGQLRPVPYQLSSYILQMSAMPAGHNARARPESNC